MKWFVVDVHLYVDGKEIALNEFVQRILSGMTVGAVTSLRDVEKNWQAIRVEVNRSAH